MKNILLFISTLYCITHTFSANAEGAGITVSKGTTTVNIRYNDNVFDKISGMEYVRSPSGALFDIIYLLKTHQSNQKKNIDVDIDNHGGNLWIYRSTKPKKVLVDINKFKALDKNLIINTLCKELSSKNCVPPIDQTLDLFIGNSYLAHSSSDLIEFGCFPCRIDRSIALSDRYEPEKPNPYPPAFKKVTDNKESIYHYFNKLRD